MERGFEAAPPGAPAYSSNLGGRNECAQCLHARVVRLQSEEGERERLEQVGFEVGAHGDAAGHCGRRAAE